MNEYYSTPHACTGLTEPEPLPDPTPNRFSKLKKTIHLSSTPIDLRFGSGRFQSHRGWVRVGVINRAYVYLEPKRTTFGLSRSCPRRLGAQVKSHHSVLIIFSKILYRFGIGNPKKKTPCRSLTHYSLNGKPFGMINIMYAVSVCAPHYIVVWQEVIKSI